MSSGVPIDPEGHFELIPEEDCNDDNLSNYSDPFKSDSEVNEETVFIEEVIEPSEEVVEEEVEGVEQTEQEEAILHLANTESTFNVSVNMFKDNIIQISNDVVNISDLIDNLPPEMKSKSMPLSPDNCHVYCGSELISDWSQPVDKRVCYTITHDLLFFCVQDEGAVEETKEKEQESPQTNKKQSSLFNRFRKMFTTNPNSPSITAPAIDVSFVQFIQDACDFLSQSECCQEGLFRLSGNYTRIRSLQDALNSGSRLQNLHLNPQQDCHNVAGLVKQRLRELPACILDYSLLDGWRELSKFSANSQEFPSIYTFLSHQLPPLNRQVMDCLLRLLKHLLPNQEVTRMNASNLGTVFGPNLLFSPCDDMTSTLESTTISSQIVTNLLLSEDMSNPIRIIAMARMEYDFNEEEDDDDEEEQEDIETANKVSSLKEGSILFLLPIEDELDGWWTAMASNHPHSFKVPSNYVRIERINRF